MDRCKAEMERVREKRRVEERRSEKRKGQKKEDADARKGRKVAKHCIFPMVCGSGEGRKVGSLKRRVRSHLARWEMKNCTPLWREAHFQVKMYKKTPASDNFWKLRCRKCARRCGAKHMLKSKCTKHLSFGAHLEVAMAKTARRCGAKHISKSKCTKHTTYGPLLDVQSSFRVAGARDCAPSQKWAKREGFVALPKTMAGVGHLKRICKDAFSVAGAVQETFSSELFGGQGADFLRGGCILEHQIFRFAEMISRDRHSTSYDLASLFRGRRNSLDRWTGKIAKRNVTRPSALQSTFHFWRKSRRIALFLMLSSSKIDELSQNCFVLDVVKFKKWRSLAELLRFWRCHVQTLRTSRRIASFLMMSTLKNEEVSQNCCVF